MGLEERERQGRAGWQRGSRRLPPAPRRARCLTSRIAHRTSRRSRVCECVRVCPCECECLCVYVCLCACPCALRCAGRAEQPEPGGAFCGAASSRTAAAPPRPSAPPSAPPAGGGAAAPRLARPAGAARPSAPLRAGCPSGRPADAAGVPGEDGRGAGGKQSGTCGEQGLDRKQARREEGEREEKAPANPVGEAGPAGGPRSSPTLGRLAREPPRELLNCPKCRRISRRGGTRGDTSALAGEGRGAQGPGGSVLPGSA